VYLQEHIEQLLPIHAALFEEHRIKSIKSLMTSMITAELRVHCRIVEQLSTGLEALSALDPQQTPSLLSPSSHPQSSSGNNNNNNNINALRSSSGSSLIHAGRSTSTSSVSGATQNQNPNSGGSVRGSIDKE
jgi:hypothetical protein